MLYYVYSKGQTKQTLEAIKMKKIHSKNFDKELACVWYMNEDKVAVAVDVIKTYSGWKIKFGQREMTCFMNKAEAVARAKKWLKESMACAQ
jgi:hypothetical protein